MEDLSRGYTRFNQDDRRKLNQHLTVALEKHEKCDRQRDESSIEIRPVGDEGRDVPEINPPRKDSIVDHFSQDIQVDTDSDGGQEQRSRTVDHDLTAQDVDRLRDIDRLSPTKNADLCSEWGFDSGPELHSYISGTLSRFIGRNENDLIILNHRGTAVLTAERQAGD